MIQTQILDALNWRYAIKKYDADKKLTQEQLALLFEAVRMSPSSFGLQPYKIIHVTNPKVRNELKSAAYGQTQVTDASDFLVFVVPTNLNDSDVDDFIGMISKAQNATLDSLKQYGDMIKGSLASRTAEQNTAWSVRQAYIALGILIAAAALLRIDVSPMEGFDPKQFDEILELKNKNLTSVVTAALGYRSTEDSYSNLPKVRRPKQDLFIELA
jgi:nitroreductase/dihydropteridine reductase